MALSAITSHHQLKSPTLSKLGPYLTVSKSLTPTLMCSEPLPILEFSWPWLLAMGIFQPLQTLTMLANGLPITLSLSTLRHGSFILLLVMKSLTPVITTLSSSLFLPWGQSTRLFFSPESITSRLELEKIQPLFLILYRRLI